MKESSAFGLEIESLRLHKDLTISKRPHPYTNSYIDRDFSEAQVEVITPVCKTIDDLYKQLEVLYQEVNKYLEDEILWPYSIPPDINEEDIIPAQYKGDLAYKTKYRHYLAKKYGKKKMLYCGIHFNYSLSKEYANTENYLHLAKQLSTYAWLLVVLLAASPSGDYASIRNSIEGYWNPFIPEVSFDSIEDYMSSIQRYVDEGLLYGSQELYYPIRLKPKGINNLESLRQGISHLEIRVIDLNPFDPYRIDKRDLEFIEIFIVYLLHKPSININKKDIITNIYNASYENIDTQTITLDKTYNLKDCTLQFLQDIYKQYPHSSVKYQLEKINNPTLRYSYRIKHF